MPIRITSSFAVSHEQQGRINTVVPNRRTSAFAGWFATREILDRSCRLLRPVVAPAIFTIRLKFRYLMSRSRWDWICAVAAPFF
jgi:hypothetical protein